MNNSMNSQNMCEKKKWTYDDVLEMRRKESKQELIELTRKNEAMALKREESVLKSILGRSGIMPMHQRCTVDNFVVTNDLQRYTVDFANAFIERFSENSGECFTFSGDTGTGKNHLAAAICNQLMCKYKTCTCMIVTITALMIKMRKCYGSKPEYSEDEFFKQLIKCDLLILDEIGLQSGSDNEKIVLNHIIDQRIGHLKPVGILTNLDNKSIELVLGPRIIRRLKSKNRWFTFKWGRYA